MSGSVILIAGRREHQLRKDAELAFYQGELAKLHTKLGWLTQEIRVTQTIIDLIEQERVLTPDL